MNYAVLDLNLRYLYKLVFDRLINRAIDMECVHPCRG